MFWAISAICPRATSRSVYITSCAPLVSKSTPFPDLRACFACAHSNIHCTSIHRDATSAGTVAVIRRRHGLMSCMMYHPQAHFWLSLCTAVPCWSVELATMGFSLHNWTEQPCYNPF